MVREYAAKRRWDSWRGDEREGGGPEFGKRKREPPRNRLKKRAEPVRGAGARFSPGKRPRIKLNHNEPYLASRENGPEHRSGVTAKGPSGIEPAPDVVDLHICIPRIYTHLDGL